MKPSDEFPGEVVPGGRLVHELIERVRQSIAVVRPADDRSEVGECFHGLDFETSTRNRGIDHDARRTVLGGQIGHMSKDCHCGFTRWRCTADTAGDAQLRVRHLAGRRFGLI